MSEKTAIIITHYEEPEYLNLLLQSIRVCSSLNEYEIIIVDNKSESDNAQKLFNSIRDLENYQIIHNEEPKTFSKSIMQSIDYVSSDSEYLVFSHSDNVILSKSWLDFLIESEIDNNQFGAICVGPMITYTGPGGQERSGPNYNFLFTKKSIFEGVGRFEYKNCDNIGTFLGYQHQLQEIDKEIVMANPLSFVHHYGLKKVTQEQKVEDIRKFNSSFIDRANKYSK